VVWATAIAAVVTIAAIGQNAVVPWAVAVLVSAAVGRMAARHIRGVTGDVFGASIEVTESIVLVVGVVMAGLS
jgi:cobalamin synthase